MCHRPRSPPVPSSENRLEVGCGLPEMGPVRVPGGLRVPGAVARKSARGQGTWAGDGSSSSSPRAAPCTPGPVKGRVVEDLTKQGPALSELAWGQWGPKKPDGDGHGAARGLVPGEWAEGGPPPWGTPSPCPPFPDPVCWPLTRCGGRRKGDPLPLGPGQWEAGTLGTGWGPSDRCTPGGWPWSSPALSCGSDPVFLGPRCSRAAKLEVGARLHPSDSEAQG